MVLLCLKFLTSEVSSAVGYKLLCNYLSMSLTKSTFCGFFLNIISCTTVSGLQTLIKCANHYINEHGLAFNASKTSCVIFGKCYFEQPKWLVYSGIIYKKKYDQVISQYKVNCVAVINIANAYQLAGGY